MKPIIEVETGPRAGERIELVEGRTSVGRDPGTVFSLVDAEVSRFHCAFDVEGEAASIRDLGSTNGTYVNGELLDGPRRLRDGDAIAIGGTRFRLRTSRGERASQRIDPEMTVSIDAPPPAIGAREAQLAALLVLAREVGEATDHDVLAHRIAARVRGAVHAKRVSVHLMDVQTGALACVVTEPAHDTSDVSVDLLETSMARREALRLGNAIAVPLAGAAEPHGAFFLETTSRIGEDELSNLAAIGRLAGVALENLLLRERLEQSREAALAEANRELEVKNLELGDANRRLEERAEAVVRMTREREEFLHTVSHELRTPLLAIRESASLIASGDLGVPAKAHGKFLEIIHRNSVRLGELVDDLLDLSRLAAGKMRLTMGIVDLGQLVEGAGVELGLIARQRGIELVSRIADALPRVPGDEGRLGQVLTNLLGNALKFTPAGGRVVLRCGPREGAGGAGWVRVEVADTGPGVPPEMREKVFERFHTEGGQGGGTGLGLAIAKEIVLLHGGEVGVDENPGGGSLFWFQVPVTEPGEGALHGG